MSDLDDFFAKRLDEEASFPNRGKNWKQMSQRLDAFDSGMVKGKRPVLRGWQIATFLAVAAAGFLWWKMVVTQRESKVLRQEVIALQSERSIILQQLGDSKKTDAKVALQEMPSPVSRLSTGIQNQSFNPLNSAGKVTVHQPRKPDNSTKKSVLPAVIMASTATEKSLDNFSAQDKVPLNQEENLSFSDNLETIKIEPIHADSLANELTTLAPTIDSMANEAPKIDSIAAEISKLAIASNANPTPPIKPVVAGKNRFRIGAQASVGLVQPHQKGVSSLLGQGITLEVKALRSLWVIGSIDWLHQEVSTQNFVPKFHPPHDTFPKPPDGGIGGHQDPPKLVLVESSPRRQQFALGIRYELPIKGWLQPSIRIVHDWVHISPTLVTYKFEEDEPGPGPGPDKHPAIYTAEKFDAQWLSNQWRFGLGLQKDIPNWTFSLWADYSKDFSAATPSFDALYLHAGAQFRF